MALVLATVLAVVWTWPLLAHVSSRIAHDAGDPVLNTWILWWNAQAVPLTDRWWSPPIFFPLPGAISLSEHLLGLSVIATPLQLAGAGPLTAYNTLLLLSYALSAFFAYLLAFRLTGSPLAAAFAGVAFGCAPYRASQIAHIQVLTSQWMPAMLLGMHGYVETGRRRWLALFGAAWLLQSLSNGYYMLFLPALIVPWIAWFTPWRTAAARKALALAGVWAGSSLLLVPLLWGYYSVHTSLGLARNLGDIRQFSATLHSFARAHPLLAFWPAGQAASQEDYLFPGATAALLAVAGAVGITRSRSRRSARGADLGGSEGSPAASCILFYGCAALLMFALALGPGGEPDGPPSLLRPYTWLLWLPGYDGLRVPARFAMPGMLCLALASSCSLAWHLGPPRRWRTLVGSIAVAAVGLEGFTERMPLVVPPPRIALPESSGAAILELPADDVRVSAAAMYRAMFHGQPLVNGYSGHTPHHYAILSLALWRGDSSVLRYFARDRPLIIVVNRAADRGGFRTMIEGLPRVSTLNVSGAGPVYFLPRQTQQAPSESGATLPCKVLDVESKRLRMDCGPSGTPSGIEFALRGRYDELDERLLIEASDDGQRWQEVWLGWTGEFALDAALRDPREMRVRIPFASTGARYLRVYPAPAWMVDEIRAVGS